MGSTLAALIAAETIPPMPSPLGYGIKSWRDTVFEHRVAYCRDATRASAIYVSDSDGDDGNDGQTEGTAVQTLAQASTLLGSSTGVQILLKRGDIWLNQSIVISNDNVKLGAYGTGEKPVLMGATRIPSGSTWTSHGSGRYSIAIATTDADLVMIGDPTTADGYALMRASPMQRKTSTLSVGSATTGAYYGTGSVLHVKLPDGSNPSAIDVWYRKRSVTVPINASGVRVNAADRCHISDLRVLGYGNAVGDQNYNIQVTATNGDQNLVSGCDILFNASHHCYGSYAGTGGSDITIWDDMEVGYCNADASGSTIGVSYCNDGEQEFYRRNVRTIGGPLDYTYTGADAVATTQAFFSHAGGAPTGPLAFGMDIACTHEVLAGNACSVQITLSNTASAPSARDAWDEYDILIFDEYYDGDDQPGGHALFGQAPTCARINCKNHNVSMREFTTSNSCATGSVGGAFINCTFTLDAPSENGETFGWLGATATNLSALFINCGLAMTWTGTASDETNNNRKGFAGLPNNGFNSCLINSVFTMIPNGADPETYNTYNNQRLNLADNQAVNLATNEGGGHHCAYWGIRPDTNSFWLGFDSQTNELDLHGNRGSGPADYPLPDITARPAATDPIVGHASYSVFDSESLEYDQTWQIRTNDTLGALEIAQITSVGAATRAYAYYRRRRLRTTGNG
jgi:hypothetical protein